MSRKETVPRQLSSNMEKLQVVGVQKIGIFDSVARGEGRGDSDVDILDELRFLIFESDALTEEQFQKDEKAKRAFVD